MDESRGEAQPRIPTGAPLHGAELAGMDTKQRMVVTAAKLLQRQGYHATGMQQVVTEAAAPRGSIYHHFPGGKEELAVQALEVAAEELSRAIRSAAQRADSPVGLLRGLGAALATWLTRSRFLEGCPVSTVVLETAPTSTALSDACAAAYAQWTQLLVDELVAAGVGADRAVRLATTMLAAIEGALLLSRAQRDTEPLGQVTEELAGMLQGVLASA